MQHQYAYTIKLSLQAPINRTLDKITYQYLNKKGKEKKLSQICTDSTFTYNSRNVFTNI